MTNNHSVPLISAGALNSAGDVRHAFFTREGGVSEGLYASLNCGPGSNDDPARVQENRDRAMNRLDLRGDALATPYQVHGTHVEIVTEPWPMGKGPQADALVTKTPNIALGILTADCTPVLFADTKNKVVGIAHAGWKGALAGILEATMTAMEDIGGRREETICVIGPCITQRSYEVSEDFRASFTDDNPANQDLFIPGRREGHLHFDLPGYLYRRLNAINPKLINRLPFDTCADESRFFSYRRSVLKKEADFGRNLSVIFLEK